MSAGALDRARRQAPDRRGHPFLAVIEILGDAIVESVVYDPATKRATLNVWAEVDRAGDRVLPIKNSLAEVELA